MMSLSERKEVGQLIAEEAKLKDEAQRFAKTIREARGSCRRTPGGRRPVEYLGEGPGAVDADQQNKLLPLGYRLRRDQFNGRWRLHCAGSWWSFSKSWGAGREQECTKACVRAAGARHTGLTGESCSVMGLF